MNVALKKKFDLEWFWIPYGEVFEDSGWRRQAQLEVAAPHPKDLQVSLRSSSSTTTTDKPLFHMAGNSSKNPTLSEIKHT